MWTTQRMLKGVSNMKRVLCFFMAAAIMIVLLPLNCFAQSFEENSMVTYFSDGSYMVETVCVFQTRASGTVTGSKEKHTTAKTVLPSGKQF